MVFPVPGTPWDLLMISYKSFPKTATWKLLATLTEYSQQVWIDEHTAALQTSVTKAVLQKNTVED